MPDDDEGLAKISEYVHVNKTTRLYESTVRLGYLKIESVENRIMTDAVSARRNFRQQS